MLRRRFLLLSVLIVAPSASAGAQGGSGADIITGRVVGPASQPVARARVEATSIETGVTRSRATDAQGRYTIVFLDGGGQYRVTVRSLGLSPQTMLVARAADEDRLVQDFTLSSVASVLETVVVTARTAPRAGERPEPGTTERVLSGEQLARLPIDPSDPNVLALLQPGVVGVAATDSTAAGFSVVGQRTDQNLVTLDGLTFGTGTVPQEAIRSTRVITSTYDVSRGQFTGGQVATTTRGGTNVVTGTFTYSLRDPRLELDGDESAGGQSLASGFTQHQLSGGIGGPIVKDRLFWFGSFQLRRRLDPLHAITLLDPGTIERLGVSADSAARFKDLAIAAGVPLSVAALPGERHADNASVIGRADWTVNDDHSVMARFNWQGALQRAFRSGALALPSHAGEEESGGAGAMMTVTSVMGRFINQGRAYVAGDERATTPYLAAPEGRVRIASELPDGMGGINTLSFGGNTAMPSENVSDQVEIADELSWLSSGGGHRFRLGALVNHSGFDSENAANGFGSFIFNSLQEFEANTPTEFRRSLRGTERRGGTWNAAIHLGDTWRWSRAFQLTCGLRLEGSAYDGRPAYNPAVDTAFGRHTDEFPRDVRVSPRVGFTWQMGRVDPERADERAARQRAGAAQGGGIRGMLRGGRRASSPGAGAGPGLPATIVRGGVGEFRGRAPAALFQSAMEATGLPGGEQQLACVGTSTPIPDWSAYLASPATIPSDCAGPAATPLSARRPGVTVFDPEFSTPRAIRASLGVTRRLSLRYSVSVDYSFALGTSLYGLRDLNLDATPEFTLISEGNRPVFVPPGMIVPSSGAVGLRGSRRVDAFGQVIDASSRLRSVTHQATLSVNGVSRRALLWNLSYTTMRSRDQTGFGASLAGGGGRGLGGAGAGMGTAGGGDPNAFEWGTADLERRHSVLGTFTWLARPWLDLGGMLRVVSGAPYTPRVSGDVNGDGARNDRAFIIGLTVPDIIGDSALANGMQRLLASSPERVAECIVSQQNRIAARNSCRGEWTATLDLQASLRPWLPRLGRRLAFVVTAINPLTGLDRLLHGSDLRGWGQPNRPDATLLYVRGFDPARQRFLYQVNERFGDNLATRTTFRSPFMLGLQARLQMGPDRQREMLQGALGAMNARGGARAVASPDFGAIMDRIAPDPSRMLVDLRDSLGLTDVQVVRIQLVGDTLRTRNAVLVDSMTARAAAAPDSARDVRSLFQAIQPLLQQARGNYLAAIESIRGILTPGQWSQLPETFRNPRLRR